MRLVEIAGGIASGKTTLLRAISNYSATQVLEDHRLNPFCTAFYSNPSQYVFETELGFLLQHYHFAKIALRASPPVILDHSFELDFSYAKVGLLGSRLEIFSALYQEVRMELGYPDVIIFVRCSPEEELRRIQQRGRDFEQTVELDFLRRLNHELEEILHEQQRSKSISVIEIDSERTDFRSPGIWSTKLTERLKSGA